MKFDIDVPNDCSCCAFSSEGGYSCNLLNGKLCHMLDEQPRWCPFNIDGAKIEHEGVVCIEKKKELSYRQEAHEALYRLYKWAIGCDEMTVHSDAALYFAELMRKYIGELEKKIRKEKE